MSSFVLLKELSSDLDQISREAMFRLFPQRLKAQSKIVTIAGIDLPVVGRRTISEMAVIADLTNKYIGDGATHQFWNDIYHLFEVTVFLRSRHQPGWNISDSLELYDSYPDEIDALVEYVKSETDGKKLDVPADVEPLESQEVTAPAKKDQQLADGTTCSGDSTSTCQASQTSPAKPLETVIQPSPLTLAAG